MGKDPPEDGGRWDHGPFLAILSMMIFGSSFWAIVIALREIPPVTLSFLRAFIAALFMGALYLFMGKVLGRRKWLRKETVMRAGLKKRGDLVLVIGTAFFGTALPNILQNTGMMMMDPSSTSSLASLIQGVGPVFTIFLAFIILHEGMDRFKVTGLVISIPCTIVLTTYRSGGLDLWSGHTLGAVLNLLTAVSYSFAGILLKKLLDRKADPVALLGLNSAIGAAMIFPVMLIFRLLGSERPLTALHLSPTGFLSLFYLSVCVYAVAAIMWYRVLRSDQLSRVTFYVFLLPVFTVVMGYLLLDERLDMVQITAGVILLAGVWISQRSKKRNIPSLIVPEKA